MDFSWYENHENPKQMIHENDILWKYYDYIHTIFMGFHTPFLVRIVLTISVYILLLLITRTRISPYQESFSFQSTLKKFKN